MGKGTERERAPGVWELRVHVGIDPLTGKRVDMSRTLRKVGVQKRRDAMRALQAEADTLRASWSTTLTAGEPDPTVGELLEQWQKLKAGTWSPKTAYDHGRTIESELLNPERGNLRDVPVTQMRTEYIDKMYIRMLAAGSKPSMLEKAHRVLRGALTQAVIWEWIPRNPAEGATIPQRHVARVRNVQVDGLKALLRSLQEDPDMGMAVRLSLLAGQRRGSITGLEWLDVDWDAGELLFSRRIVVVPAGDFVLPGNKTGRTVRLAIDPVTMIMLKEYRALRQERALAAGVGRLKPDSYILARDAAGLEHWRPDTTSHRFRALADSHGLPDVRLHDLRHAMVSALIGARFDPAAVSERAGHSSKSITLDIYAHSLPANDRAAADWWGEQLDA